MNQKKRSLIKSTIWEIGMFFLIAALMHSLLKTSITESILFNIGITIIKIFGLTIYDFCWERKWN